MCDYFQDGKWAFPHSLKAVILENPFLFSVKDDWSRLHWSIKNTKPQKPLPQLSYHYNSNFFKKSRI